MARITQDSVHQIVKKLSDGLDDAALQHTLAINKVIWVFDAELTNLFDTTVQNLFEHMTAYITKPGGDSLIMGFGLHEDHYKTFSIATLQAEALLEGDEEIDA